MTPSELIRPHPELNGVADCRERHEDGLGAVGQPLVLEADELEAVPEDAVATHGSDLAPHDFVHLRHRPFDAVGGASVAVLPLTKRDASVDGGVDHAEVSAHAQLAVGREGLDARLTRGENLDAIKSAELVVVALVSLRAALGLTARPKQRKAHSLCNSPL